MKKGKITVVITIALSCFALTTIMCMQFKIVKQTDITLIETMREEELRSELADYKILYKEAEEQYNEKLLKLKEYRETQESTEAVAQLVEKELQQVNMYMGNTDVQGQGIVIRIKDVKNEEIQYSINVKDLLFIVDYLKLAGAEAISINEERIINMSDIVSINNTIIYINQQRILEPYEIKAIGDPTKLESTLLGNGGYIEILRNLEFDIEIKKENKIIIPKYNKNIGYKYIQ